MDLLPRDFEHLDLPQHPAALQALAHGLAHGQCEAQSSPAARYYGALAACLVQNKILLFQMPLISRQHVSRQSHTDFLLQTKHEDLLTHSRHIVSTPVPTYPTQAQLLDASHTDSAHANLMSVTRLIR